MKNLKLGSNYEQLRHKEKNKRGKDYSQRALAELLGIPHSRICDIEKGKREPTLHEIKAYRMGLGAPYEYLFGETRNSDIDNFKTGRDLGLTDEAIGSVTDIKEEAETNSAQFGVDKLDILDDFLSNAAKHYVEIVKMMIENHLMALAFNSIKEELKESKRKGRPISDELIDFELSLQPKYNRTGSGVFLNYDEYNEFQMKMLSQNLIENIICNHVKSGKDYDVDNARRLILERSKEMLSNYSLNKKSSE